MWVGRGRIKRIYVYLNFLFPFLSTCAWVLHGFSIFFASSVFLFYVFTIKLYFAPVAMSVIVGVSHVYV